MREILRFGGIAVALALMVGCGDDSSSESDAAVVVQGCETMEPPEREQCPRAYLDIVYDTLWPGGGHELVVRAEDENGAPSNTVASDCLHVQGIDECPTVAQSSIELPTVTAIVINPGTAANVLDYRDAVIAFIDSRPADEAVAIYRWGSELTQVADFTTARARTMYLLDKMPVLGSGESPMDANDAAVAASGAASYVLRAGIQAQRAVVMLSADASAATPLGADPATILWVVPEPPDGAQPHKVLTWQSSDGPAAALLTASDRLDDHAESAFHRFSVCSNPDEPTDIRVSGDAQSSITHVLTRSLEGQRDNECTPAELETGTRAPLDTIELLMDADQMTVYEERVAAIDPDVVADQTAAKQDFDLTVKLSPSFEPATATAHLRGQNALQCERKSFTVNLDTEAPRYLHGDLATDEFYLIAMCEDEGYFLGFLGDSMLARVGLFPMPFRYVEVKMNGTTLGTYLMVMQTQELFRRNFARSRGLVRRQFDGLNIPPEVKYTNIDEAELLGAYEALVPEPPIAEADWPAYIRARMDVTQYLRMAAVHSLLENGDWIDETNFASLETVADDGSASDYFVITGWDLEDLGGPCHFDDMFIYPDPFELLRCPEANLDHVLFANPEIYAEYVGVLEQILADTTQQVLNDVLAEAESQLFALLERPGVAAAMTELGAADADEAKAAISAMMNDVRARFIARTLFLGSQIAAYHAAQ